MPARKYFQAVKQVGHSICVLLRACIILNFFRHVFKIRTDIPLLKMRESFYALLHTMSSNPHHEALFHSGLKGGVCSR
jgi:hypothetical protein